MNAKRTLLLALPCLALAACSETTFQNTLGIGKSAPDETRVRTVQPLSVPPDLELRPPERNASTAPANSVASSANGALAAPPAADGPKPGTGPRQADKQTAANPQEPSSSFYDIYRKRGISLYHPDGRRKKIAELNRELAEKLKEEKRRQNPNYGTIFNMGSLWK